MNRSVNDWLLALMLTSPMLVFYAGYYLNHEPSLIPSGFIQDDNVTYVAYAKQYLDDDKFNPFYSNPFNDSGNYPRIYFQTQNFFIMALLKLDFPLQFLLPLFTITCSFLCFRIIIAIYDRLASHNEKRTLSIWLFAWGGGVLALAGIPVYFLYFSRNIEGFDFILDSFDIFFILDPGWGWWGLNLGRSLFFSCEAYYHLLFLSTILCILRRKWLVALAMSFVLSASHPFTGVEFLCIACLWLFVEKMLARNKNIPWWLAVGMFIGLAVHVYYYLFFLDQFADHLSVREQFSQNWRLRIYNMIPAYCIVGGLALLAYFRSVPLRNFFYDTNNRLFFCWFIVALALSNHELFIHPPMQPIHFTRGYIWTSLFLLGLPALHFIFSVINKKRSFSYVFIVFVIIFLSDNFLWILNYARFYRNKPDTEYISKEQQQVLHLLNQHSDNNTLILSSYDPAYLSTVYTKAYPWVSHPTNTPFYREKKLAYDRFISNNIIDTAWEGREVILVFHRNDSLELKRSQQLDVPVTLLTETESYRIFTGKIPNTLR